MLYQKVPKVLKHPYVISIVSVSIQTLSRITRCLHFHMGSLLSASVWVIIFHQISYCWNYVLNYSVLDVYFLHFDYFPIQILKLVHLRYLAVNVTYELPASMSQLRNLKTMLICGPWECSILSLEYWTMPSLRHLICSAVSYLKIPPMIRNDRFQPFVPEYIQSLSTISFSSCKREVFCIMPQLKKLGIYETKEDYITGISSTSCVNLKY
ncbi:hypothetical protein ACH5RR_018121 [Cinchona calisaya]|uniref:Maturase K n=1 Tax=Cinchona calisaya TaxID=153742 RepID=A0ABD2ZKJ4_9GENT